MEYSNKDSVKKVITMLGMPVIVLLIVLLVIKGVIFLAPIYLIGYFVYKGIKKINLKSKNINSTKRKCGANSSINENSFDYKIVDVEYEDI